jgi:hypothetical protein
VFAKLTRGLRRPFDYVASEWNRMAPRERRLVAALGGALGAALVVIGGFLVFQTISELEERNDAAREALSAIARHRDEFLEAKSKMTAQEVRIGSEKPQLGADLEAAAKEAGFPIPETIDRPAQPAGKRYLEHNVDFTLRRVGLVELSKFLNKVETGRRLILITKLSIKRVYGEGDKLDVIGTATAFERVKEAPKKKAAGPAAKGEKT